MGYSPLIWGKEGWHFIHFVALNYPKNPTDLDRKRYERFFNSLQHILPCEACSFNYSEKIKKHPPNLKDRNSIFKWTVDIHNSVNKQNGKPEISYQQALKFIFDKYEIEELKKSFGKASFITLLLLTSFLIIKK